MPGKAMRSELYRLHSPTCSCGSLLILSSLPLSLSHPRIPWLTHPLFPVWSRTCPHTSPRLNIPGSTSNVQPTLWPLSSLAHL